MNITTNFSVSGITCEACLKLIKRRVGVIAGVKDINVSLSGNASVIADRTIEIIEITKALEGTDYKVN
ncbi:hypothetical protein A2W14_04825 [Candidatus Gottesmanbacteria bacterium RBG_16_37_8]|uniref:HMA domain-containing protein n=1 Tax=Candidatus Gottesmanbacteria bacterium RBG_16_37_8 TaxID=1798371 RepID=A0A1F5YUE9_9BACT|nr:MAG: hypothetical protein A2W14_04825 [Candidatus Gottesmanbacteria bacterium RBG_16_37_8]